MMTNENLFRYHVKNKSSFASGTVVVLCIICGEVLLDQAIKTLRANRTKYFNVELLKMVIHISMETTKEFF